MIKMKIFDKIKQGFKDITQRQQLEANYTAAIGQTIGFSCATVAMTGSLYFEFTWTRLFFIIVLVFATLQTFTQARTTRKALKELIEQEKELDNLNKLMNVEV